jgi:hypothetical protein
LRVGVGDIATEARSAKDNDESVLFHGFYENLYARDFDLSKRDREGCAFFAADSTSAAIGDLARRVDGAKVASDCDVTFFELEPDPGGFQGTSTDLVVQRIVAE